MLLAAAVQQSCNVVDLGIARDDVGELEKIMDRAFSAGVDIILTSGGVSMGDRDYVKPLLERRGKVHFSKVIEVAFKLLFGWSKINETIDN